MYFPQKNVFNLQKQRPDHKETFLLLNSYAKWVGILASKKVHIAKYSTTVYYKLVSCLEYAMYCKFLFILHVTVEHLRVRVGNSNYNTRQIEQNNTTFLCGQISASFLSLIHPYGTSKGQ